MFDGRTPTTATSTAQTATPESASAAPESTPEGFSSTGPLPPVAAAAGGGSPPTTASERAFGGGLLARAASAVGAGVAQVAHALGIGGHHEPKAEHAASPAFFNQRANKFAGPLNGTEEDARTTCNVTTLAMQLVTMAGSADAVKRRTIDLMRQVVAVSPARADELMKLQVADVVMELFSARGDHYWEQASQSGHAPFFPGFYQHYKNYRGSDDQPIGWNEVAACLLFTAQQYDFVAGGAEHDEAGANPGYMIGTLKPALARGSTVMLGTRLTGGHIVMLVGVEDHGVRINDPYGMRLEPEIQHLGTTGYIRNGTSLAERTVSPADQRTRSNAELLATYRDISLRRASFNAPLKSLVGSALSSGDSEDAPTPSGPGATARPVDNWGENNFYTWDEVAEYQIGRWNNVLDKKSS